MRRFRKQYEYFVKYDFKDGQGYQILVYDRKTIDMECLREFEAFINKRNAEENNIHEPCIITDFKLLRVRNSFL